MFCNVPHPPTHLNTFCVLCFIGRTGEGKSFFKNVTYSLRPFVSVPNKYLCSLAVMVVLQNGDDKNYYYKKKRKKLHPSGFFVVSCGCGKL